MTKQIVSPFFAGLFIICFILVQSLPAMAQPAGCDPAVLAAMQATAQARVIHSKAVDDEIYKQDDSVLAVSCFNKAAGVAAKRSGAIFSGDFRASLAPVIDDALTAWFPNFSSAATIGGGSGKVNYTATSITDEDEYNCSGPKDLWDEVNRQGVANVPYATFADLRAGRRDDNTAQEPPGTAVDSIGFRKVFNLSVSVQAFGEMDATLDATAGASTPDYRSATTSCTVLTLSGLTAVECE